MFSFPNIQCMAFLTTSTIHLGQQMFDQKSPKKTSGSIYHNDLPFKNLEFSPLKALDSVKGTPFVHGGLLLNAESQGRHGRPPRPSWCLLMASWLRSGAASWKFWRNYPRTPTPTFEHQHNYIEIFSKNDLLLCFSRKRAIWRLICKTHQYMDNSH